MDAPRFRRRLTALRAMRAQADQDAEDEQIVAEA